METSAVDHPFFFCRPGGKGDQDLRVCCRICAAPKEPSVVIELQKKRSGRLSSRAERKIKRACKQHAETDDHKQNALMMRLEG